MKQRRNTKQRQLVLEAVRARRDHPNANQIYLDVRAIDDKISRGTVYRNLNFLTQSGKLLHVKAPNADRFDCRLDSHYHLLCTECDAVCDAPLSYYANLDQEMAIKTGYAIKRHQVVFEGLCPNCQNTSK